MKANYLKFSIVAIFIFQITLHGQKLQQGEVDKLNGVLNTSIVSNFKVELKSNKAHCSIGEISKTLDLRNDYEIAEDSLTKEARKELYKGSYKGSVYWKYNFEPAKNSEVVFKTNNYQQLFCTISFKEQDTIFLKSQLNAYTSHHKTSDSALHHVDWTGDKFISLLLTPKKLDSKIVFELNGITISGKFARSDKTDISKNYTKALRTIFKREFKMVFESEEMSQLISEKIKH